MRPEKVVGFMSRHLIRILCLLIYDTSKNQSQSLPIAHEFYTCHLSNFKLYWSFFRRFILWHMGFTKCRYKYWESLNLNLWSKFFLLSILFSITLSHIYWFSNITEFFYIFFVQFKKANNDKSSLEKCTELETQHFLKF